MQAVRTAGSDWDHRCCLCADSSAAWRSMETSVNPNAEGERINDPSNRHNKWRYRLHLTIGELAAADSLQRLAEVDGRAVRPVSVEVSASGFAALGKRNSNIVRPPRRL